MREKKIAEKINFPAILKKNCSVSSYKKKGRLRALLVEKKYSPSARACGLQLVRELRCTLDHFFPDLYDRLSVIPDPRSGGIYSLTSLLVGGLSLFLFKQGSRHQQNQLRQDRVFRRNYSRILGVDLPHGDTVESLLRQLEPEELQKLLQHFVRALLRKKVLHKLRLLGKYFLVAIDGSGTGSFEQAPSDHAIHKTRGDKTRWYEYVLEAKLICPNGFCISLCSEWVENPEGDFDKQDCELKAFARLADGLKKAFPRLPICILADGL